MASKFSGWCSAVTTPVNDNQVGNCGAASRTAKFSRYKFEILGEDSRPAWKKVIHKGDVSWAGVCGYWFVFPGVSNNIY